MQPNPIHKALAAIDLEPGASWEEIVARHKVLVRFWHSDKARVEDRQIADKEMARFNHARDVLKEHYQSNEHHGGAGCLCKPLSEGSAAGAAASDKTYGSQTKSSKTNASQSQTSQSQTSQSQSHASQSQSHASQSQSQASQSQSHARQSQTSQSQRYSAENSGYNNSGAEEGKAGKVSRFYSRLSAENKVAVNVLAFFVVIVLIGGSLRILFAPAPKPIEMSLPAATSQPLPTSPLAPVDATGPADASTNAAADASTNTAADASTHAPADASVSDSAKQAVQSLSPSDQPLLGSSDEQSDGQSNGQNNLERIKALSAVDRFEKAVKKNEANLAELDNEISRLGNTPFRLRQLNDFRAERLRQLDADRASLKEARRVLEAISTGGDSGENVKALELLNRHERRRN